MWWIGLSDHHLSGAWTAIKKAAEEFQITNLVIQKRLIAQRIK
jgi:hypothetical protein